jgi:protease-4
MKKTRTRGAILFVTVVVVAFAAVAILIEVVGGSGTLSSSWTDAFEYHDKVGVVTLEGTIAKSDDTLKQLRKFRKKRSVKAIVIRINSPGGAVAPAQEIYREIEKVRKKKPVVASMETVAASAAYYIASNTDQIVCSQGTITGSIGVIMFLPDVQKVIERIGVSMSVIKAGKFKDIGSMFRSPSEEERSLLETFAADIHEQFINDVAQGRKGKITKDQLRAVADGRFFTGEKAKEIGLVDTMGNFYDAVAIAAKLGGIKEEPELIYPKKKWDSVLDLFTEAASAVLVKAVEQGRLTELLPAIR